VPLAREGRRGQPERLDGQGPLVQAPPLAWQDWAPPQRGLQALQALQA
jgi:hypothetical protein